MWKLGLEKFNIKLELVTIVTLVVPWFSVKELQKIVLFYPGLNR